MKSFCVEHVDVSLPADQAFAFVADLARWPLWLSFVVCAQQAGEPQPRSLAAGQEIELCVMRGRRRSREALEVTQFVAGAFLCMEGSLSAARRLEFRFEQRRGVTRVHARVSYPVFGGAVGRLRDALFARPAVARDLHQSMTHLKEMLEERVPAHAQEAIA